ncbi:MAG: PAS domain S-box protein [Bacteroidales bacterium]|jgi:hypothetical protein
MSDPDLTKEQLQVELNKLRFAFEDLKITHARDIAGRKQVEEALNESQKWLNSIYNTVGDIILYLAVEGDGIYRFISVNPAFSRVTGLKQEMVVGKLVNEVIPEPSLTMVLGKYKKAIAENIILHWEEVSEYPTGRLTGDVSIAPVFDNKGRCTHLVGTVHDITERRQTEMALEQSEERLRGIISNIADWVWEVDEKGVYTYSSQAGIDYFGKSGDDVLGKTPFDFMTPDEAQRVATLFSEIVKNKAPIKDLENWNIKKNGEMICLLTNGRPILDDEGNLKGYRGVDQDITERKQAADKLHEKDIQFRKLSSNVPDLIFQFTRRPDGTYFVPIASAGIINIFGCSPEDVIDDFTPIGNVIFPEDAARVLSDIEYSAKHLSYFTCEFRVQIPGRPIQWIYSKSTPEKLPDGSITWYGFNTNITVQKQAEETLSTERRRLSDIVNGTNVGTWEWNIRTGETIYNERWAEIIGYTLNEVSPSSIETWMKFAHPDDKKRSDALLDKHFKCETDYYECEIRMKHKSNGWIWVLDRGKVHERDEDGKPLLMSGTHQDITERKCAEEELIIAKERAEESDRLKSAFLANMSHEIRTPMNGILGFADLLKEPGLSGEEQQQFIGMIEKGGTRLLNIINDIISISKVEAGQMEISISDSNVNEQIEYIYHFFTPEVVKKGMRLSYTIALPASEAIIKTDHEKIYAILTNLVKNAIKYSNEGSIEFGYNIVETDHGPSHHGPSLRFFVKDTGIGIPKDRQVAIFERFVQADISDKKALQGAGLGLSISKAYVEMLGGKIWVESEEGIGSVFFFTIPYHPVPKEVITGVSLDSLDDQAAKSINIKILIAEDDVPSDILITLILKTISHELYHVRTGIEAVEACRNDPDIDLILMDIQMPDMNGYDATRLIREFNKEVVIIAQTAYGLTGDKEKALAAGCNDYISKPILKKEFLELIQKYFPEY